MQHHAITHTSETDVLVIGTGPVGLMLACELSRRAIACRIIDTVSAFPQTSRATFLQPRSMEVLDSLGVADQVIFLMDGRPVGPEVDRLSESVRMIVIFRVTKAWKGVREARIAVTTGPDPDVECGFPFEKDGQYLVYADQVKYAREGREGWELSTSRCHRTRGGPAALSEARALGKPEWAPAP